MEPFFFLNDFSILESSRLSLFQILGFLNVGCITSFETQMLENSGWDFSQLLELVRAVREGK